MAERAGSLAGRRIGFVGGGNMAEALVKGLLASGSVAAGALRVSDVSRARREHLAARYAVGVATDNRELGEWADVLVLAVKPQHIGAVCAELAGAPALLYLSIAAGVATTTLAQLLGGSVRIVRAMPNAAALVLTSATAVAGGPGATAEDVSLACELFSAVGRCVVLEERQLDAVTGLSGSGPAFVLLCLEAMADGGVRMGLARDTALLLAAQTFLGAAQLCLESGEHPALLRDRVTSPAGTTSAGLAELEREGVRGAMADAVEAATERSRELGRRS